MKLAFFVFLCCVVTVATRLIKCHNCGQALIEKYDVNRCGTCESDGVCYIGFLRGWEYSGCASDKFDSDCEIGADINPDETVCTCTHDFCNDVTIKCYKCEVKQGEFNISTCGTCETLRSCYFYSFAGKEVRGCRKYKEDACWKGEVGSWEAVTCTCNDDFCNGFDNSLKCYKCEVKEGEFNKEKCDTCTINGGSCYTTYFAGKEERGCDKYASNRCHESGMGSGKRKVCTCTNDFCNDVSLQCYNCENKRREFNWITCGFCNIVGGSCYLTYLGGMEKRGCRKYRETGCWIVEAGKKEVKTCTCNEYQCNALTHVGLYETNSESDSNNSESNSNNSTSDSNNTASDSNNSASDSNPLIASKILAVIVLPIVARLLITTF